MAWGWESFLEAAGGILMTELSPGSIPIPWSIPLWSTGHDNCLSNGRTQFRIQRSASAFEPRMIRNSLPPSKSCGSSTPHVPPNYIAYNWLVSWHVWGVRIRTGSCWSVGFGKASLFGACPNGNVSSVKNQNQKTTDRHELTVKSCVDVRSWQTHFVCTHCKSKILKAVTQVAISKLSWETTNI